MRELENVLERAVILTSGSAITAAVIPLGVGEKLQPAEVAKGVKTRLVALEEMEREHIEEVLKATGGNKSRTADILRISRRTLDRRIADFGLMDGE